MIACVAGRVLTGHLQGSVEENWKINKKGETNCH